MTDDETNPESSPSLADGFFCPEFERECRAQAAQCDAYAALDALGDAYRDNELDDRALAAAEAVFREAATFYRDWEVCESEFPFSRISLAAILRPFLQSKPNP